MSENIQCQSLTAVAEANVTIMVKGLAICNYNKNNRKLEAVFLRHVENHNLKLTVNKCRAGVAESSQTYNIDKDEKLYVVSDSPAGQTDDYPINEAQKLNKIIDFSAAVLHNGQVSFHTGKQFPLTFLSISGGVYYAKTVSRKTYDIKKGNETVETRRIGLGIGADIVCGAGGKTEIITTNHPNMIPALFAETGVTYEIIFDNDCPAPAVAGECDFNTYYDLIDMPEQFTLKLAAPPAAGGEPEEEEAPPEKSPPCNSTVVSLLGSGLSSLSELV